MSQSMSEANWKTKKLKQGRGSQTAGSQKGNNCKATMIEKYMAKRNRSYKHPRYREWLEIKHGGKPSRRMAGD